MRVANLTILCLLSRKKVDFRSAGPPLPSTRSSGACVTINGRALYMGGTAPDGFKSSTVFGLREDLSGWDEIEDIRMPEGWSSMAFAVYEF